MKQKHITIWIVFSLESRLPVGMAHSFEGAKAIADSHIKEGEQLGEERQTIAMQMAIGSAS